jgi:hypothetical protein
MTKFLLTNFICNISKTHAHLSTFYLPGELTELLYLIPLCLQLYSLLPSIVSLVITYDTYPFR